MPISLPDSPTDGQTVQIGTIIYTYDATTGVWNSNSAIGPTLSPASSSTTVYADMTALIAATGMSNGDQAFVTGNNNLYIYSGSGWYKIATVQNDSPSAITGVNGTYELAIDGTATTITAVSTDPEGFPLTWSYSTSGLGSIATVSQTENVFVITPSTTEADAGTFTLTINATDGVNGAVSTSTNLTLEFILIVANSKYTTLLATVPSFTAIPYSFADLSYQNKSFSFSSQGSMNAVQFNANGTKMYAADYGNDIFYQYSLNPAWDISTASYDNVSLSFTSYSGNYTGLWFKPDGSVMYASDGYQPGSATSDPRIDIYTASSGNEYVLNQYSYSSTKSLSAISGITDLRSIVFKSDGSKFFALCNDTYAVYEFTMSTAWDVANAQHSSSNIYNVNTATGENNPRSIYVTPDGTQLLMSGSNLDKLHRFVLTNPWQVNSATYTSGDDFDFSGQAGTNIIRSILDGDGGKILYLNTSSSQTMFQYNFESVPKIIDSSSNSHSITVSGNPYAGTFSPYRAGGYSMYFDGGDYVDLGNGNLAIDTEDFTIETWVNVTIGSNMLIATNSNWNAGDNTGWRAFIQPSGTINITASQGTWNAYPSVYSSTNAIPSNEWAHVVICRDSGVISSYINGIKDPTTVNYSTSLNQTGGSALSSYSLIGAFIADGGTFNTLTGYLSDFHFKLGSAKYTTTFSPPTERLTVESGTDVLLFNKPFLKDESTNAYTTTISGDPKISPFSPYDHLEYSATDHGGSVYFDGSGDYLLINNPPTLGANDWTFETWYYAANPLTYNSLLSQGAGNNALVSNFTISTTGQIFIQTYTTTNVVLYNTAAGIIKGYTWNHIVLTHNYDGSSGGTYKIYVNGNQVGNVSYTSGYYWNSGGISSTPLAMAQYRYSNQVNGACYFSDWKISNSVTYSSNFTPPTAPLSSSGAELHIKGTDASIIDKSQGSNLKLIGNTTGSTTQVKFAGSKSMYFDGTTDYIISQEPVLLGTQDFTAECWLYYQSGLELMGNRNVSDSGGFSVRMTSTSLTVGNSSGTGFGSVFSGTTSSLTNAWHHIAVSRSSGVTKIYVDGSSIASYSSTINFSLSNPFVIGYAYSNGSGADSIQGYIQDFRITKGLARYTANFTPPAASLEG